MSAIEKKDGKDKDKGIDKDIEKNKNIKKNIKGKKENNNTSSAKSIEVQLNSFLDPVLSAKRKVTIQAQAIAQLNQEQKVFILHWVELTACRNAEMAFQFVHFAPVAFSTMTSEQVEQWLLNAIDILDETGLYAAIDALQDIDNFSREVKAHTKGMQLKKVSAMLELFIHGLHGRRLKIEQAVAVYTDTESIFLPRLNSFFASPEDNLALYRAQASLLWAQNHYGSWCIQYADALSLINDEALPLLSWFETIRLYARLKVDYPGITRNIDQLLTLAQQQLMPKNHECHEAYWPLSNLKADMGLSITLLNHYAQKYTHQKVTGYISAPGLCISTECYPDKVATVRLRRILSEKKQFQHLLFQMLEAPNGSDNEFLNQKNNRPEKSLFERDSDNQDKAFPEIYIRLDVDKLWSRESEIEMIVEGRAVALPGSAQTLMQSMIQDLGEIPSGYLVPAGDASYQHDSQAQEADVWCGAGCEEAAFLYDEWDYIRQHYRKNWCVLRETDVRATDSTFVAKTLEKYSGLVQQIRKTFEILRGEDRTLKKQTNGEEVDIDALVEGLANVEAGLELGDQLFLKRLRNDRNIAVMFMVDMSGSTKGWINDAERESLVLLCEALETLGDRYAIYGFSGMTRQRCELYRIKTFEEAYSEEVQKRIGGIKPKDYTRMGVVIRHLSGLLTVVEARTKLLITLSDGKPDDFDGYRGEYGIEDTRQALMEARQKGIHPFCITIDKEAGDYLPHMYGAVNYTVIDEVNKLPAKVSEIYRKLTT